MGQPLGGSTSTLGQFADEFKDQAKDLAGGVVKAAADEPKKILEQILGSAAPSTDDKQEQAMEDLEKATQATDDPQIKQQLIQKQQAEADQKQKHINLLHQRIEEEKAFYEKEKQEDEAKIEAKKNEEESQKPQQIVQLQHEQEKAEVLGSVIKQQQGSKETKAWGAG